MKVCSECTVRTATCRRRPVIRPADARQAVAWPGSARPCGHVQEHPHERGRSHSSALRRGRSPGRSSMAASANPTVMSVEEYLESERHSAVKREYVDGHVYAMAGGTRAHGVIAVNVTIALGNHLRGGPCRVYNSDVKVQLTETRYVYPDVSVGCDERDRLNDDEDVVRYPTVAVEVLSSSTEAYDRGAKVALYRSTETLRA